MTPRIQKWILIASAIWISLAMLALFSDLDCDWGGVVSLTITLGPTCMAVAPGLLGVVR